MSFALLVAGAVCGLADARDVGAAWTIEPAAAPNGTGTPEVRLTGVSCVAPTACFAVGTWGAGSDPGGALIEAWDWTRWTVSFSDTSANHRLNAVSCSSPTACVAVGGSELSGPQLNATWNGVAWTASTSPGTIDPTSLACRSVAMCIAVGSKVGFGGPHAEL